MRLPKDVKFIIERLQEAGYEAYAVGGCVRDTILGREPDDWDITTSAKPLEIKALFHPTIDTGIQHGTVTVLRNHVGYEVTTYRIDGVYEDSRHPKEVTFTANLSEDLLRRDFTINAMAYNDTAGLVDEYGGLEDLKNGEPSGGWQCGALWDKKEHQTWCATGFLRMVLNHVFGIEPFAGGLMLTPHGMQDGSTVRLENLHYHDANLTIEVNGCGDKIKSCDIQNLQETVRIPQEHCRHLVIPSILKGEVLVRITLE